MVCAIGVTNAPAPRPRCCHRTPQWRRRAACCRCCRCCCCWRRTCASPAQRFNTTISTSTAARLATASTSGAQRTRAASAACLRRTQRRLARADAKAKLHRRPLQPGFAGPAASFLQCLPRSGAAGGGGLAGPSQRPQVSNAVYQSGASPNARAPAELCDARSALATQLGGAKGVTYALTVAFNGSVCAGTPVGRPLRLNGACRAAGDEPAAGKSFRRDTLACVAGAAAPTVRAAGAAGLAHACCFADETMRSADAGGGVRRRGVRARLRVGARGGAAAGRVPAGAHDVLRRAGASRDGGAGTGGALMNSSAGALYVDNLL